MKKILIPIFLILSLQKTFSYSISAGVSGGPANLTTSSNGGSIDVNLYFGSGVTRFGLGGKKIFYSESGLSKISELFKLFVRHDFLTVGLFYGGHVSNAENYLKTSFLTSDGVTFQRGGFVALSYFLSPRWELGVEGLYHQRTSNKSDFFSSWVGLNFWWP